MLDFDKNGYEVKEDILSKQEVSKLLDLLEKQQLLPLSGGIRRIEQLVPEIATLAKSKKLLSIASQYLNSEPRLVRAIYFDKSPENNWFVTWHQDKTISVSHRFELDGWGQWTMKAGAWHVQPPLTVLENMVTIRLHLDDSTIENGCLKFLPSSHQLGLIKTDDVLAFVKAGNPVYCEAALGSAIIMRPHIIHASEKASKPGPRRVLHFEYSSYQLPKGIKFSA